MAEKRLVTEVPEDVHRRAKAMAAMSGRPLQDIIEELILQWIQEQEAKQAEKDRPGK